jgi:hypothetical protein
MQPHMSSAKPRCSPDLHSLIMSLLVLQIHAILDGLLALTEAQRETAWATIKRGAGDILAQRSNVSDGQRFVLLLVLAHIIIISCLSPGICTQSHMGVCKQMLYKENAKVLQIVHHTKWHPKWINLVTRSIVTTLASIPCEHLLPR